MNFIKKVVSAILLFGVAGVFLQAQETTSDDLIIEGKKAKIIYLTSLPGIQNAKLSGNEQYVFGATGGDEDDESGFIYEIATGRVEKYAGFGMVEVIDFDNYVTTQHIVRDGQKIEFKTQGLRGSAAHATADLSVISYDTYIDKLYVSVLFDGQGNIIDTMPHAEQGLTAGYGSYAFALSNDGSVIVGRTGLRNAHTNMSPAIWDRNAGKTIATVGGEDLKDGTLYGVSGDGTIATGEISDEPCWIAYDKTKQEYVFHPIPRFAGYGMGWGTQVKVNNNVVLGNDQVSGPAVYERQSWLYYIDQDRKVSLHDHLNYLYGLNVDEEEYPLFTPLSMSEDGKIFTGYTINFKWYPYVILLEDEQIHPLVRNVSVRQLYRSSNVEIQWDEPMAGDYTLKEYKVYRDSTLIATLPLSNLSYTDRSVPEGIHFYQVQAIYTDAQVSDYSPVNKIDVIAVGGCLPVKEILSDVIYNRTVKLYWGKPSADIGKAMSAAPVDGQREADSRVALSKGAKTAAPKYVAEDQFDYVDIMNMQSATAASVARVGNYLYVGHFNSNLIQVYNTAKGGVLAASVEIQGLAGVYDMAYHNNMLYCVSNDIQNRVFELSIDENDPLNVSLSHVWYAKTKLTHIAYLEGLNNGQDMILVGNYNGNLFYNTNPMDENDLVTDFDGRFDVKDIIISGSAYHNGRLYLANQNDGNSSLVEVFDWESGEHLYTANLLDNPFVAAAVGYPTYSALISGLNTGVLEDGTVVLDILTQPQNVYNQLVTVEIESSPDVDGYNVYCNGEKINEELITARHYSYQIFDEGKYIYTVEYVAKNGCTKRSDGYAEAEVTINPIGECAMPRRVNVFESNEMACITWEEPEETDGFVGFNIYRNGEMLAEKLLDLKFFDSEIEKAKNYVYTVEAFYDNSCAASDSVTLVPTFEGTAEAPSAVTCTQRKVAEGTNVTTTWELPYFETPMALGYCSVPVDAVTLDGSNVMYALIGWDSADLTKYKDLYVVGIEFFVGTDKVTANGIVYVNGRLAHSESVGRVRAEEWNRIYLKKAVSMNANMIDVGYVVQYNPNELDGPVVAFDYGPAKVGYSDQISPDGVNMYSLAATGYDANLCINALVVRRRDMETAAKMPEVQGMEYLQKQAVSLSALQLTEPVSVKGVKTTSESYSLKGFNVYRDGEQLNESVLTSFSFVDQSVEPGEYFYSVSAVYANEEVTSDEVFVEIQNVANDQQDAVCPVSFLPNPVQDMLYIKGEYASLSLIDITGRVVLSDVRNVQSLSMTDFQSGMYFVKLTLENGRSYITKIVKK